MVGIETGRGLVVRALLAVGYQVFAVNPLASSRYRDRHGSSGAKPDPSGHGEHNAASTSYLNRRTWRKVVPMPGAADEGVRAASVAGRTAPIPRARVAAVA